MKGTTICRGPSLVGTPKRTSHWWVCCCGGHSLLRLGSRLATVVSEVVRQWVRQNFVLEIFLKVYIWSPVSDFMIVKLYLILDGQVLLRKGDFCCEVRLCDGFWRWHFRRCAQDMGQSLLKQYKRRIWDNPYLNNTTVLFDMYIITVSFN